MARNIRIWTNEETEYLKNNLGLTDEGIGKHLNRSKLSVRGKRHHIGNKKKDPTVKYSIQMCFFKRWSQNMAYILGFIYADGGIRIRKSGSELRISQRDPSILEKINQAMNSTYPIKKERSKVIYRLSITRKEIVDDLVALGVTPRKSKHLRFPSIPVEYFWSFLRGYFDGDGHVSISNRNITIGFTCGSRLFLEQMKEILFDNYAISSYLYSRSRNESCELVIRAREKELFFIKLYEDATIYLERKYIAMKEYFEKRKNRVVKCKKCHKVIGNYESKKRYCDNCRKQARLESYRKYDIKRGRKRL